MTTMDAMSEGRVMNELQAVDAQRITNEIVEYASDTRKRQTTLRAMVDDAIREGAHAALGFDTIGYIYHIAERAGYSEDWARRLAKEDRDTAKLERNEEIKRLADDGHTQRQIAEVVGVGVATVNRVFQNGSSPEMEQDTQRNGNGAVSEADMPLTDWETLDGEWITEEDDIGPEPQPTNGKPHVSHNSGNNEWYTPSKYIEAARRTMGGIDLDPASCAIANETVQAGKYFSVDDDGLSQEWFGNVWMNPPYAQPAMSKFAAKMRDETRSGNVVQSCVLVNNATETKWFADLVDCASSICFLLSRVRFDSPDGTVGAPLQGQAVLYYGDNEDAFFDNFSELGFIVEVVR